MALEREHRLPFRLGGRTMGPLVALVLGFTFSFAWTPCVGPVLGSVLLMASSSASAPAAALLIGVYTLGFVLPFLAVGLFTGGVLSFFKRHQAGGALDGEGGGGSADPDGGDDLYRLYERLHRISVPDRLRRASEPERRQRGGAVRLHRCRQRCVGAAGGPCP